MPMSIEELERNYRRAYRRLSVVIGIVCGVVMLTGLAAVVGNTKVAGWTSAAVQAGPDVPSVSEPMPLLQPAKRVRTVKND
jgi:hypothetical protein